MRKILLIFILLVSLSSNCAFGASKTLVSINAKAYGLYVKGRYDAALTVYKKAIRINPGYAPSYDGLANIFMKKEQYDKAYVNYYLASKLDPTNSLYKIHAQEAVYYNCLYDIKDSSRLMAKALMFSPNDNKMNKNMEKIENNNLKNFDLISTDYQNASDENLSKGNQSRAKQRYGEAIQYYINSIKLSDTNYQAYNNLSLLYLDLNKISNAVYYLKKALEHNPKSSIVYNNLGMAYCEQGNYKQANIDFDSAIKLNNKYAPTYNNKAVCQIYGSTKNLNRSIDYLKSIEKNEPENIKLKYLLSSFYYLNEDYNSAINTLKTGLDFALDNSDFLIKLAELMLINKNYDESIDYFKKAISLDSNNSKAFTGIARAYEKKGNAKDAFNNYQTAIRLNSNNAEAYKYFGLFLLDQNRTQEAKGILKKYLELSNNSNNVLISNLFKKIP